MRYGGLGKRYGWGRHRDDGNVLFLDLFQERVLLRFVFCQLLKRYDVDLVADDVLWLKNKTIINQSIYNYNKMHKIN